MAVKENKADFEQKLIRLEGQLHKAQLDGQQKEKQVKHFK